MAQSHLANELWKQKHFLKPVSAIEEKARGKQEQWLEFRSGAVRVFDLPDDVKLMRHSSGCKPNYPLFQYHQTQFFSREALFFREFIEKIK
jgi:hypothetical protein